MAIPQFDEPSPTNLVGALLFITYVTLAILLTALITYNLYCTYQASFVAKPKSPDNRVRSEVKHVQLFALLAALSFSVLSYHMMHFLIVSYTTWSIERQILLPERLFGEGGLIVSKNGAGIDLHIWHWLTTSTLFLDFAKTICQDSARYWWTQQALLVTMACCYFMGVEGRRRNIHYLWAYLTISQILPVSFAQNLFSVAMLLHPVPGPDCKQGIRRPSWQILPLVTYYMNLVLLPRTVGTRTFIPVILSTRILLICQPFISGFFQQTLRAIPTSPVEGHRTYLVAYWCIMSCSFLLFIRHTFIALKDSVGISQVVAAINDQPAVSALGWDFLLSVVSFTAWAATRGIDLSLFYASQAVAKSKKEQ